MSFSKIFFYELVIIYLLVSLFFIAFSEDLKDFLRFKKYLAISTIAFLVGLFSEVIHWTYLCKYQFILISISPLFCLLTVKGLQKLFTKLFNNEPFQMYRNELIDGLWIDNKGDLKFKSYYIAYSILSLVVPFFTLAFVYNLFEKKICGF